MISSCNALEFEENAMVRTDDIKEQMTWQSLTFLLLERIQRMKKGSALFRVSKSLVREVWRKWREELAECSWLLLEGVFGMKCLVSVYNEHTTGSCDLTWNWALMLGGFFFLCRWSRDLVVRSCSVRLTMNFRDCESSKLCKAVIWWLISYLDSIMILTKYWQTNSIDHCFYCFIWLAQDFLSP